MNRWILCMVAGAVACVLPGAAARADDPTGATPPPEYRPETWFHFIGGNIGKPGISADLEAIAGAGIGGIQLFNGQFGGPWPGVQPQITCLSPQWDDAIRHTAGECRRLGLTFTMQNCPGWSLAGGPWIAPQEAMRHIVWSRTEVDGASFTDTGLKRDAPREIRLPRPQPSDEPWRDYRDIAVLAFPRPEGDNEVLTPLRVRSDQPQLAWQDAFDPARKAALRWSSNQPDWVEAEFPAPVTLRSLELPPLKAVVSGRYFDPALALRVQAVTPAGLVAVAQRELPRSTWQDDRTLTLALPEVRARAFRFTFEPLAGNTRSVALDFFHLLGAARTDDWEARAGFVLRSLDLGDPPRQSPAAWVDGARIVDLTAHLKADAGRADAGKAEGVLTWQPPPGAWTILRFGHVNTGARNGPAPAEATGFECDKMAPRAVATHFAHYVGRLTAPGGPASARLQELLLDSWECHTQTWTPAMESEFAQRRGYALRRWLPALAGYVVDSQQRSLAFLRDWRATLNDLIVANFFGQTTQLAHARGLKTSFETALGDVAPGDILQYLGRADVPMCEFWQPNDPDWGGEETKPVLPCISAAHVYGKRRIAAESFTSVVLRWDEHPFMLKPYADHNFAQGINHLVFHTYTHNPRLDVVPGTSFGAGIGTPFLRGQTWWKYMPAFTTYLARCQMMLERGRPVADVLWYLGDEFDHKPRQDAPFPAGYRFDYCNQDVLLHRLHVVRGRLVTPEGTSWRALWLPRCPRLTTATLQALRDLVHQGALVIAAPPRECASLCGGAAAAQRFKALVHDLWGARPPARGSRKLGTGHLMWGVELADALRVPHAGVAPDVSGMPGVAWCHRSEAGAEVYFVVAPRAAALRGGFTFRATGQVELFDPLTGQSRPAAVVRKDGSRTHVALDLPPAGSIFVVFRRGQPRLTGEPRLTWTRIEYEGTSLLDALAPPRLETGLTVVKAMYGDAADPARQLDVTERVRHDVLQGATTLTGGNDWAGGDPALGTVKTLSVTVRIMEGGMQRVQTLRATEGQPLQLPAAMLPPPPLQVLPDGSLLALQNGRYRLVSDRGKATQVSVTGARSIALDGRWTLRFPSGWGVPERLELPALEPWSDLAGPAVRAFSGTAVYSCEVNLDPPGPDQRFMLDLGRVANIAEVTLNGHRAGLLWAAPYRCDVTRLVKPGLNRLDIAVTNTWRNRLAYDAALPENQRKTWTIAGPPAGAPLEPAGLAGPLQLHIGIMVRPALKE